MQVKSIKIPTRERQNQMILQNYHTNSVQTRVKEHEAHQHHSGYPASLSHVLKRQLSCPVLRWDSDADSQLQCNRNMLRDATSRSIKNEPRPKMASAALRSSTLMPSLNRLPVDCMNRTRHHPWYPVIEVRASEQQESVALLDHGEHIICMRREGDIW